MTMVCMIMGTPRPAPPQSLSRFIRQEVGPPDVKRRRSASPVAQPVRSACIRPLAFHQHGSRVATGQLISPPWNIPDILAPSAVVRIGSYCRHYRTAWTTRVYRHWAMKHPWLMHFATITAPTPNANPIQIELPQEGEVFRVPWAKCGHRYSAAFVHPKSAPQIGAGGADSNEDTFCAW